MFVLGIVEEILIGDSNEKGLIRASTWERFAFLLLL